MSKAAARGLLIALSLPLALGVLGVVEVVLTVLDIAPPKGRLAIDPGAGIASPEDVIVWDRDLLYRYAPDSEFLGYYRTNSLGYRGKQFGDKKRPGVFRIVCVGDSCTFGLGVREEDTWTHRLETILNRAYEGVREFEVLSFGVVGYSTFQTRRQLEIEIPRYAPDLVIDMPTVFNDATFAPSMSDADRASEHRSFSNWLRQRRIVRLLGIAPAHYELPKQIELAVQKDATKCRVPLAQLDDHLKASVAAVRESGGKLLVAISTLDRGLRAIDKGFDERMAVVRRVASSSSVPVAEVGDALRSFEPYSLFLDGVHPNPEGQQIVARTLFDSLVASDSLPSEPRREFLRWFLELKQKGAFQQKVVPGPIESAAPDSFRRLTLRPFDDPPTSAYDERRRLLRKGDGDRIEVITSDPILAAIEANVTPRDSFASFLWGALAIGGAPTPQAVELAARASAFESSIAATIRRRDRRLGLAAEALARGDAASLLGITNAILEIDPGECEARLLRARFFRSSGDLAHLRGEIDAALAADPEYGPALALAGILALESKDFATAQPLLERALAADPFAIDCRYGLARLKLAKGDKDGAKRELYTLLTVNKNAYPDAMTLYESLTTEGPSDGK